MWQYLSAADQARGEQMLIAAGPKASRDTPLAHLSIEYYGQRPGAALRLWLWPEGAEIDPGRVNFYSRWINWQAPDPATPWN